MFKDIGNLENYMKVELENVEHTLETFDTQMTLNDQRFSGVMRQHQAHMAQVENLKNKNEIAIKQIEDFKKRITKKVDFELEKSHMIAMELRTPVTDMRL